MCDSTTPAVASARTEQASRQLHPVAGWERDGLVTGRARTAGRRQPDRHRPSTRARSPRTRRSAERSGTRPGPDGPHGGVRRYLPSFMRWCRVRLRSFLCFFLRIFLRRFLTRDGKRQALLHSVPKRFRRSIRFTRKLASRRTEPSLSAFGGSATGEIRRSPPSSATNSR